MGALVCRPSFPRCKDCHLRCICEYIQKKNEREISFVSGISQLREDVKRTRTLPDYEAVNVLWVALVKAANSCSGRDEFERMKKLLSRVAERDIEVILNSDAVNQLLNLDPPLETVLAHSLERLAPDGTAHAVSEIREKRNTAPREALLHLGSILKTIRNKREHGFKSDTVARDREILGATRLILTDLCVCASK
jgi:hypothetical protein